MKDIRKNTDTLLDFRSAAEICRYLQVSPFVLDQHINRPVYKMFTVSKRRRGKRTIYAPSKSLKHIQRALNELLQSYYLYLRPACVHGFLVSPPGAHLSCNIVENARPHVAKKHILNIDLEDFFPSISAKRVYELFLSPNFNYNEEVAMVLTFLTCYQRQLPIGAPTSPVISNLICLQMDKELQQYCRQHNLAFTRYADDLTFSSASKISEEQFADIKQLIHNNHFVINPRKCRFQRNGRRQVVTGVVVNEKVNVSRNQIRKVRAMLHHIQTKGLDAFVTQSLARDFYLTEEELAYCNMGPNPQNRATYTHRLGGYINFIGQVRGKQDPIYQKYRQMFKQILGGSPSHR